MGEAAGLSRQEKRTQMGVSDAEYREQRTGSSSNGVAGGHGRVRNAREPLAKPTHCLECNGKIEAGTPIGELSYVPEHRRWVHRDPSCQDLAWIAGGFKPATTVARETPPPAPAPSAAAEKPSEPAPTEPSPMLTAPAAYAESAAGREVRAGDRLEFELTWPGERQFVVGRFRLSRALDPTKTREQEAEAMAEFVGAIVARATQAAEGRAGDPE